MILNRKYYFYRNILYSVYSSLKQIGLLVFSFARNKEVNQTYEIKMGPPLLTIHPDQSLVCTSCERCQEVCPTLCISLSSRGDKKSPDFFEIDLKDCIYCGLCEEVCPDSAIYMGHELVPVFTETNEWKWGIDQLAFRKTLNEGKGIVLKDGVPQFQTRP